MFDGRTTHLNIPMRRLTPRTSPAGEIHFGRCSRTYQCISFCKTTTTAVVARENFEESVAYADTMKEVKHAVCFGVTEDAVCTVS